MYLAARQPGYWLTITVLRIRIAISTPPPSCQDVGSPQFIVDVWTSFNEACEQLYKRLA